MSVLNRYLLRLFFPRFIFSVLFFSMIIELMDLFLNLARYMQLKTDLSTILYLVLLYLPKCVSFSLPVSMIFAVSFTLGSLYANNELIAIFSSGISLIKLCVPILIASLIISIGSFFFEEYVVIDTVKAKTNLTRSLLGFSDSGGNRNIILYDNNGKIVYQVAVFMEQESSLRDVLVVQRNQESSIELVIKASEAEWQESLWLFKNVDLYYLDTQKVGSVRYEQKAEFSSEQFTLEPRSFRRVTTNVDELRIADAQQFLTDLEQTGQTYKNALLDYYERFSFALTPFIVAFVSSAIGSRFRKNILLMSLLMSLLLAVVYYVLQMVAGLFARTNLIDPVFGAWLGAILYVAAGIVLFKKART